MPELRVERAVRTVPIDVDVDVDVASLRAHLRWDGRSAGGGFGLGVATPVAVRRRAHPGALVPWAGRRPIGMVTAMICRGAAASPREERDMDQSEQISTIVPKVARAEEMVRTFTAAGTGQGVVGPATTAGERTAVPLIETIFAGGYGGGGGQEGQKADIGAGGGGGGFARSRTVAILELTPDGMHVRPVVDTTAIVLAAIGAMAGALGVVRRVRRRH